MLTHAELATLEQTLRDRNVLSVYVNGEVTDVAARSQWRTAIRNVFDEIAESLSGASHEEREGFAAPHRSTAPGRRPTHQGAGGVEKGWSDLLSREQASLRARC